MSNEYIAVSQDLTYTKPEQEMSGKGQYFNFLPTGASTLTSNQRATFNIRSSTAFCDYNRSYMKVAFTPIGATAGTTPGTSTALSCMGIQSIFSNVQERISGANFDQVDNWNQLVAAKNFLAPITKQNSLAFTEGFTGVSTAGVANQGKFLYPTTLSGGPAAINFVCPIPSNLSTINKLIPLSLMNSWDLSCRKESP